MKRFLLAVAIFSSMNCNSQIGIQKKNEIKRSFFKGKFDAHLAHIKKFEIKVSPGKYNEGSAYIVFPIKSFIQMDKAAHKKYFMSLDKEFKNFDHEKINGLSQFGDYSHQDQWEYEFHCPKRLGCEMNLLPRYYVFNLKIKYKDRIEERKVLLKSYSEDWLMWGKRDDLDQLEYEVVAMQRHRFHFNYLEKQDGMGDINFKKETKKVLGLEEFEVMMKGEITIEGFKKSLLSELQGLELTFDKEFTRKVYQDHAFHEFDRSMHPESFDYIKSFYDLLPETSNTLKIIRDKVKKFYKRS